MKTEKMEKKEFDAFYKKNYKSLVKYVYGKVRNYDDAEEIVSEAFCQFIEEWGPKYYSIAPMTLLYKMCGDVLKNFRKHSSRTEKTLDFNNKFLQNKLQDMSIDIEQEFFDNEERLIEIINNEMEGLPPLYRDILRMYFFDGKSQAEIAKIVFGWQPNISNAIDYGKNMLKVRLKKRGITHE